MATSTSSGKSGTGSAYGGKMTGMVRCLLASIITAVAFIIVGTAIFTKTERSTSRLSDAERALVSLGRANAAAAAAGEAVKAVDAQAVLEKTLSEKAIAAQKAASDAEDARAKADKLKTQTPADASAAEKQAEESKKKAEEAAKAEKARLEAEDSARQGTRVVKEAVTAALLRAHAGASDGLPFSWVLFVILAPILCGVFPLSAIAYWHREVPRCMAQLKADIRLLGNRHTAGLADIAHSKEQEDERMNLLVDSFVLHGVISIFAAIFGAVLLCSQPGPRLDANTLHGMQLGFLGAYVYCLNLIYRRYTTWDLQPHIYLSCAVGLFIGIAVNYAAFSAISSLASSPGMQENPEFKGIGAAMAAILAFSLGFFPNLALRWFGRVSRTAVRERVRRSDALPLSLIDGITELHESRLQDEGIDNLQNLATADIKYLVEKTPYSAQEIVEWVDQALLYLYVDPGEIDSFRRAGVRSVTDFHDIWGGFSIRYKVLLDGTVTRIPPPRSSDFEDRRKTIAAQLATTEQRLDCLFLATERGPNMDVVRTYWENVQAASIQTRELPINQVCRSVGRALRESSREGSLPNSSDILTQVAGGLFAAAASSGKEEGIGVTAESLYGQAFLRYWLDEIAEAERLLKQCIQQFPADPVVYHNLAWLLLQNRSQESDLKAARDYAAKAVKLTSAKIDETGKDAADSETKAAELEKQAAHEPEKKTQLMADAAKAQSDEKIKAEEKRKLEADQAAYRDTLALAEIRIGNIDNGVTESKRAIEEWKKLPPGKKPGFLNTLISAAEAYIGTGERQKATDLLDFIDASDYATPDTKERTSKLREKLS